MSSIGTLWAETDEKTFIDRGAAYWENIPATNNGVLGGFGHLNPIDVAGSAAFLQSHLPNVARSRAVDCGAGIGRISKSLLCPRFDVVDLVEQDAHFVEQAKVDLASYKQMDKFICEGLQTWQPDPETYSVVWIQWVSSHLTDERFVEFLQRCKRSLIPSATNDHTSTSAIVVKENMSNTDGFIFDEEDSSVTRNEAMFKVRDVKISLAHDWMAGTFQKGRIEDCW